MTRDETLDALVDRLRDVLGTRRASRPDALPRAAVAVVADAYDAGAARLAEVEAENERLRGRLKASLDALRPFANVCEFYDGVSGDTPIVVDMRQRLDVGHLRNARAALSPVKP